MLFDLVVVDVLSGEYFVSHYAIDKRQASKISRKWDSLKHKAVCIPWPSEMPKPKSISLVSSC